MTRAQADEFSREGAVAALEERMAAVLDKEAAVFLPSGTLANHLALRLLATRGRRVLLQQDSHIYNDTGDCAQELSGLTPIPLAPGRATFSLAEVEAEIAREEEGRVATPIGVISIESPVRRLQGEVFDFSEMQRIASFARERGIGLHFDGARVFLASAYTGISPAAYAALFDTVYVSLYKYFNAAGGAVLAGPKRLLANLYHQRRMFGGSLRQAWPYAAVALYYLDGFSDRFQRAAAASEALFQRLRQHPDCDVDRPPAATNVTRLRVKGRRRRGAPRALAEAGDRPAPRAAGLIRRGGIRAGHQRDDPAPPDRGDYRGVSRSCRTQSIGNPAAARASWLNGGFRPPLKQRRTRSRKTSEGTSPRARHSRSNQRAPAATWPISS